MSVWKTNDSSETEIRSLTEVMSEQLALEISKKETPSSNTETNSFDFVQVSKPENQMCNDDELIAHMLQNDYDREYDEGILHEEKAKNRDCKVSISYSKYRVIPNPPIWQDQSDENDQYFVYGDANTPIDVYEEAEREGGRLPKCGYRRNKDGLMITKHDEVMSQRTNGKRLMEFPPGIETGDGAGIDMQISNAVYNKIRNFSIKEGKKKNRPKDKDDKTTAIQAVDEQTNLILFKMLNDEILANYQGPINTGKKCMVFYASGGKVTNLEYAVKVYNTTRSEFKPQDRIMKGDYRCKDKFAKHNPRKIGYQLAEREFHNLSLMHRFGIPVPQPFILKNHVLVMHFIGKNAIPAQTMKDVMLSQEEFLTAYNQCVSMMKKLYIECNLIHADLSEYNMLWFEDKIYMIGVASSVTPFHPDGLQLLYRDCQNVANFFSKKCALEINSKNLFTEITDLPLEGKEPIEIVDELNKKLMEHNLVHHPTRASNYPFEYCWEQSKLEGTQQKIHCLAKIPKSSTGIYSLSPKLFSQNGASNKLVSMSDIDLKRYRESLTRRNEEQH